MKRIFLALLFMVSLGVYAQDFKVVEFPDKSQKEINTALKAWIAQNFKSAKDVIQLDEENKIIVKGNDVFKQTYKYGDLLAITGRLLFMLNFDIKDNKFRYSISDAYIKIDGLDIPLQDYEGYVLAKNEKTMKNKWVAFKKYRQNEADARSKTLDDVDAILDGLERSIEKIPNETQKSEDW
ncbi:DUF4468 domain-containing protein [Sphingobacterium multivorum]|uniref:DUF4468 domain-containing protein n=1 Tax=Sphingobacterium multivorum TaxID=28454 RepID=UPI003DA3B1AD